MATMMTPQELYEANGGYLVVASSESVALGSIKRLQRGIGEGCMVFVQRLATSEEVVRQRSLIGGTAWQKPFQYICVIE